MLHVSFLLIKIPSTMSVYIKTKESIFKICNGLLEWLRCRELGVSFLLENFIDKKYVNFVGVGVSFFAPYPIITKISFEVVGHFQSDRGSFNDKIRQFPHFQREFC